jgi:hypothetical protein
VQMVLMDVIYILDDIEHQQNKDDLEKEELF